MLSERWGNVRDCFSFNHPSPLFRQQVLLEMEDEEYWGCLQAQAAAMDNEREKVKAEKKQ